MEEVQITLYEFNKLSENKKYSLIFNKAIYLDVIIEKDLRFALYAIGRFFIQIQYNNITNKIESLTAFKTGYLLDKFSKLKDI